MCNTKVFERFQSDLPMFDALAPSNIATLVNQLLGLRYWKISVGEKHFKYPNSPKDNKKPE